METDNSPYKRNLWLTVKTQKKGFSARRTRLIRNGIVIPWSQTHIAFRDHYATERWAPPEIPLELLDSIQQGSVRMGPASPILPISAEELTEAIRKLKKGKAPGHDALTSDMVRALDAFGEEKILALLNSCLKLRKIPVAWKRAVVISFYKGKGKDSDPTSYRPIFLLPVLYKLYASILQVRLALELDSFIRPTQYGFRASRGTRHALFLLRRLQDWSRALTKPVHLLFLDWKQAFDTLDHSALIAGLQRWNLHPDYIDIIADFYTSPEFIISGMNGQVAAGVASSGIRQGCPLSPYLFILILSLVLEDTEARLMRQGTPTNTWSVGKPVFDLEYADDTLLFGISTPQLEAMLHALQTEAQNFGLALNLAKSEILVYPSQDAPRLHFLNGDPVPTATNVRYLGSLVTWDAPASSAITVRFHLAKAALQSLRLVWNSRLQPQQKLRIFNSVVVSTLIYGLSCLTFSTKLYQTLDSFYFRLLRSVLGIKAAYISRISNYTVWDTAGKPMTASQLVLQQQIQILIEVLATPPEDPYHHIVFCSAFRDRIAITQKTTRGRPTEHWLGNMLQCLQEPTNFYFSHRPSIHNPMTLNRLLNTDGKFKDFLVTAPTRAQNFKLALSHLSQRAGQE